MLFLHIALWICLLTQTTFASNITQSNKQAPISAIIKIRRDIEQEMPALENLSVRSLKKVKFLQPKQETGAINAQYDYINKNDIYGQGL